MSRASDIYKQHKAGIREISSRYPVANIRVFGSVLRGDDNEASDIDILVDTFPEATLFDLGGLQDEIQVLLGIRVDLLTPGELPSRSRAAILKEAQPV